MIVSMKTHIPYARSSLVSRPRLMRMLDEGLKTKLTLISAQAGYGKTTLLSQWARQCDVLVAWVTLDRTDNDWTQFWRYVIAAIEASIADFGRAIQPHLEDGPSVSAVSARSSEPAMKMLLNQLHLLANELVIILDDYQWMELPAIHHSLTYVLEHLPAHIHLYIASRTELPIPTARLLAKGEFHRIAMEELRFRLEEGVDFFQHTTELSLTKGQTAQLLSQTEGWVGGLKLAALSLQHSGHIADRIDQFSGHEHRISDYLLEEVFCHQPEPLRDFLLQTSILSRMNHALCEAVTGQTNGQEQLERLERLNLFIVSLDDQRKWYRYHQLLADFLQKQFSAATPDEVEQAHRRAAWWLEQQGLEEEAVEHYLQAGHHADAVRLIEKNLRTLMQSKTVVLLRWVTALPENCFEEKPMIELFYMATLLGEGQVEEASVRAERALLRFRAMELKWDEADRNVLMGNLYFLCSVLAYLRQDLAGTSAYFELLDHYLPEGGMLQTMGRNRYQGYDAFDDYFSFLMDPHAMENHLLQWISRLEKKRRYPFIGFWYAVYFQLMYEWNRLEELEPYVSRALRREDVQSFARILIQVSVIAARIRQAGGSPDRALDMLRQLKSQIDSPDYELFLWKIEAEQANLSVRQGSLPDALAWLQRCGLSSADEVSLSHVVDYLVLARVLSACDRGEEALHLLERMHHVVCQAGRTRGRIQVLILQSVTLWRLGRSAAAQMKLETALELAEPEGYIRSFIDEGPVMAELLLAYGQALQGDGFKRVPQASLTYVKRLLSGLHVTMEAVGLEEEQRTAPVGPPRVRVQCFGRFKVLVGDGNGSEIKWRTSKTEELLAYLIHHRGEAVDRHRIMDSLWGDVDAVKAAAQFNTTVHYLRKNLSRHGIEDAIHHARGFYRVDMGPMDCDYEAFHQLVAAGAADSINAVNIKQYENISSIYKTGYMEGNQYPWAEQARTSVENDYVDLLLRMHEHYLCERNYPFAVKILKMALACAPLNEDIHTKLIRAYLLANDRIAAIRQYDVLSRRLRDELGIEPGFHVKQLLYLK